MQNNFTDIPWRPPDSNLEPSREISTPKPAKIPNKSLRRHRLCYVQGVRVSIQIFEHFVKYKDAVLIEIIACFVVFSFIN